MNFPFSKVQTQSPPRHVRGLSGQPRHLGPVRADGGVDGADDQQLGIPVHRVVVR